MVLVSGWVSLSAESEAGDQIPYIMSGGIGGLFILWIGTTLWLSADLRDEWRKLDALDESVRKLAETSGGGRRRSRCRRSRRSPRNKPSSASRDPLVAAVTGSG